MASFLVESFAETRTDLEQCVGRGRLTAEAGSSGGIDIRDVRSFLAATDEICFRVLEAPSAGAVTRVSRIVELDHDRITEVLE